MNIHVPTQTYNGLQAKFDSMNKELFDGKMPHVLITLRAMANSYGYYHTGRFVEAHTKNAKPIPEIALNPKHFAERPVKEALATLAHEICHLAEHVAGREPTRCYHSKWWANLMESIGLMPSDTGRPGGKRTGPRVSHYIIEGGKFDRWYKAHNGSRDALRLYQDRLAAQNALGKGKGKGGDDEDGDGEEAEPKSKGRIKFTCKGCDLNAWAKPSAKLRCIPCDRPLRATESATVGGDEEDA